ncbi:hypothetical protein QQF64_007257 [Cirrhinus molitorella]|uniref:Uncharacterized protein n=1 Tax=Cirrhinus molitorella TaxID=172907 RepID=A0ABR3MA52_9TELE
MYSKEGLAAHYPEGHSNTPQGCHGGMTTRRWEGPDLHHKKGELWPQEALRLVGNEGPNGLLGNWAAGKQVIAVKWFWLTNQMACLPGWKN